MSDDDPPLLAGQRRYRVDSGIFNEVVIAED